jgi:hypothetical protein
VFQICSLATFKQLPCEALRAPLWNSDVVAEGEGGGWCVSELTEHYDTHISHELFQITSYLN